MQTSTADRIRETVREAYGAVARQEQQGGCCGGAATSCCGAAGMSSTRLGYSNADLAAAPIAALEGMIAQAGFLRVRVSVQAQGRELVQDWNPASGAHQVVASALIEAVKPA